MAKEPRKQLSGKEARYLLKQNNINLAWLAEQIGISPQSLHSRLNAATFSTPYQLEINNILGKRLFEVDMAPTITETKGRIPVIDMRVSAGFGVSLLDGNEQRINEYVTMDGLNGCVGIYVYGESMSPEYRAGDIVFVRQVLDATEIDYGRPYVICTRTDRVLKCIYQSKHDATLLRLTSLNEETNRHGDRLYPDKEVEKDSILFIYKVVALFRREQI
jgi:phage repressor protein C with HTH and peptisase S24 domain